MSDDTERREVARLAESIADVEASVADVEAQLCKLGASCVLGMSVKECATVDKLFAKCQGVVEIPNDDERRRVAEKLRASIPGDGMMRRGDKGWSLLYRTIFGHYMHNQSAGRTYSEVADRLADLIEPSCDRDALLALADTLGSTRETDCRGCKLEGAGCAECSSGVAHEAARRIREACGEVVA